MKKLSPWEVEEKKRHEKMADLLGQIVDQTNSMGMNVDAAAHAMAEKLYRQHRTLQQSFIHVISEVIAKYAGLCGQYGYDLRNEQASKWAIKVAEVTDQHQFPMI